MIQYKVSDELTKHINTILVENNFLIGKICVLNDLDQTNDTVENKNHTQSLVDQNSKKIDLLIQDDLNEYIDKLDDNSDKEPMKGDFVFNVNVKLLGALFYKNYIIAR